ncbi:MAG: hypothetical protein J7L56_12675 [Halomonas sp.]|nr:hypothetical protein [Halomonas sp.]MCD6439100.1 hypothetical protein [Halomonas sp.]
MQIATLGPSGNNHELIALRYLAKHGQPSTNLHLFEQFEEAFEALIEGRVSQLLQCTAHFSHSDCVGRYMHRAYPVDVFIAGSKPLALVAQRSIASPHHVAIQPATRHYTDLSSFGDIIEAPTTVAVAEGLLAGTFEAGICAEEVVKQAPEQLKLVQSLGPALDTWVVYTTTQLPAMSPLFLNHVPLNEKDNSGARHH